MERSEALAKARAARKAKLELAKEKSELVEKAATTGAALETVTVVRKDSDRSVRKERIPFGLPVQQLQGVSIDGYRLRWIMDYPGRIPAAQAGGYEFVESDEVSISALGALSFQNEALGSKVARVAGRNSDGSPLYMFLMKLPNQFAEENDAIKAARIDQIDDAIMRTKKPDIEKGYVPKNYTNVYEGEFLRK